MAEETSPATDERTIRLRYAGTCRLCGASLAAGTRAVHSRVRRSVRCVVCEPVPVAAAPEPEPDVPSGVASASARRVLDERKAKREKAIRQAHPRLGRLILALSDDPQSTRAWKGGAVGEETLGARLDGIASPTVRMLHDRRIPRTRANIDHLVVCRTGVLVVDAKRYVGRRPALRVDGGLFSPRRERLLVGSRDASSLLDEHPRHDDDPGRHHHHRRLRLPGHERDVPARHSCGALIPGVVRIAPLTGPLRSVPPFV